MNSREETLLDLLKTFEKWGQKIIRIDLPSVWHEELKICFHDKLKFGTDRIVRFDKITEFMGLKINISKNDSLQFFIE